MEKTLEQLVNRVRLILEDPQVRLPCNDLMGDFPAGACRETCLILGLVLREKGFGDWWVISGEIDYPYKSHCWLRNRDWIIDITADQFDGYEHKETWIHERHDLYLPLTFTEKSIEAPDDCWPPMFTGALTTVLHNLKTKL